MCEAGKQLTLLLVYCLLVLFRPPEERAGKRALYARDARSRAVTEKDGAYAGRRTFPCSDLRTSEVYVDACSR